MEIARIKEAHRILASMEYKAGELERGYAGRTLHVDLSENTIETRPVSEFMKETFTGGKGFDLYLMWREIDGPIEWDDPRNMLCISAGPLGGTPAFSGSGKCIITGISPTTRSVMDSNVGGHFGPLLKFAGFDALAISGQAEEDVLLVVDGKQHRVTVETAPHEATNTVKLAEQLHQMYSDTPEELQCVSVVSAGPGAEHTLIGCLNVSFYDFKRQVPRFKQAGRGGLGSVFRKKKLKALVARAPKNRPRWTMRVQTP